MLYGVNCAKVGVPLEASNRSHAATPGSASIWLCSVFGGPPISEYAINTWNALGVHVGVAEGDPATVAVGVGVAPHGSGTTLISTVFVSALPLNPPTTRRLFPIAVPPVKECATFVFGPVLQVLLPVS